MPSKPTFYFVLFLSVFLGIFIWVAGNSFGGLNSAVVSPELFAALLISQSVLLVEYGRINFSRNKYLSDVPAIVMGSGFISSMSGITASILGVGGHWMILLLMITLLSMVTTLYFVTDMLMGSGQA